MTSFADIGRIVRTEPHRPTNQSEANIVVHVPANGAWPFRGAEAGPVTVALDLFDSGDARSWRAAASFWQREFAKHRFDRLRR